MLEQLTHPITLLLLVVIIALVTALYRTQRRLKQHQDRDDLPVVLQGNVIDLAAQQQSLPQLEERFSNKADEAMRLNQTFQKFVPRQFVDHFSKHGSDSLELGRADEDDVAILFCDIRGFTSLSESMSPQELMNFLNSYFLRMNDPIHQNNGFIDKFIGDAIMALFDHPDGDNCDKAIDSVNAAIDLHYALAIYNQQRSKSGYPPIRVGVGIHFGPVIIGTVGSDDRMDTTVIGDSVNIAYRLESLAPKFHTDIVVSAQVLKETEAEGKVIYRLLDFVRVKGRKAPIEIYEVLNHLPTELQELKLKTADLIEKGVGLRKKQQWDDAEMCFQQALVINPQDKLVIHHMQQCQRARNANHSEGWDGATMFS